jgi:hypothetical protein
VNERFEEALVRASVGAELFPSLLDRSMQEQRAAVVKRMRDRGGRVNKL